MNTRTFMWYGVKVRVWNGYMGMKRTKGSGGGGCSVRRRGGATVNATDDVVRAEDGRVVMEQVSR